MLNEINKYYQDYQKICSEKYDTLNIKLFGTGKIRLSENNLQIVQREAAKLIKFNYENVILKYDNITSCDLLEKQSLGTDDWFGFTGRILEEIFGVGIMKPLEEMHEVFNLKVDHLNLMKYTSMIADSNLRSDLDVVDEKYNPDVEKVRVEIPEKSIMETFKVKKEFNSRDFLALKKKLIKKEKSYNGQKVKDDNILFIPSQLPNISATVAALTYNNESNNDKKIDYSTIRNLEDKLNKYFRLN